MGVRPYVSRPLTTTTIQAKSFRLTARDLFVGKNNAYLCKRKQAGGVQFSRDPMNLVNKHSRKYEGFVNDKAIGIKADDNTVNPHQHPLPPMYVSLTLRQGRDEDQDRLPDPPACPLIHHILLLGLDSFPQIVQERGQLDGEEGVPF